MAFPDVPVGWAPPQVTSPIGGSLDELAARYGLPPGTPQSVILERLFQDPTYRWGDTGVAPTSDADRMAAIQGYTLGGRPLADQAYITPQGSDASYYYMPDGGPVMTGYNPEQREQIESTQRDARVRGIGSVAALVGGAAALGATPWGSSAPGSGSATVSGSTTAAGYGGPATTYPLAAGGPIAVSPLAGAGGAGAAGAGAAATFADKWLPTITGGVNALLGYRAADQAADAESNALQAAIAEQRRQYDQTRTDFAPWMAAGSDALNQLNNPQASFQASPGYEWARSEGQRDIGNSFSARGGAQSGNALRALSEFQTGLAQQDFGNWWNQQSQRAGLGQNAVTNVANFGQNTAANTGNYLAGQGVSRASGVMGKYGSLAQGLNDGVSNWLYRRRLN